jgi:hypothetical protein
MSTMLLLFFVRYRYLWSIPNSITGTVAIVMFISITMTAGILVVYFTAPNQSGMFF